MYKDMKCIVRLPIYKKQTKKTTTGFSFKARQYILILTYPFCQAYLMRINTMHCKYEFIFQQTD